MPAPSEAEFQREKNAIRTVADYYGYEIEKAQKMGKDDYGADAILVYRDFCGEERVRLEIRSKGFANHSGKVCAALKKHWDSKCLANGIEVNRRTVEAGPFLFCVEFPFEPFRVAHITSKERLEHLLAQPNRKEASTNSGNKQSVVFVPLDWFQEII